MTIDEAIEHAEEIACGNDQCANDYAQLADWLRELRRARMEIDLLKTSRDVFKVDAQMYMAENANLREQVVRWQSEWESERDYADQMEAREKKAVGENAKLRELVRDMMGFFEDGDWCVKCERARDCQAQEQYEDDCLMRFVFRDRMRELGIEAEDA